MLSKVGLGCIVGMTPTCSLARSNDILIGCLLFGGESCWSLLWGASYWALGL